MAKPTNTMLDKQNFKCLPNNVCLLGQGFWTCLPESPQSISCLPNVLQKVTEVFICLWSKFDEKWKGSTHYEINMEVIGSVCQPVKVAYAMLKEHEQSIAYIW